MPDNTPEIKQIREWSEAIERNPFAFGPSIDKQEAIKILLIRITNLEATCAAALTLMQASTIEGAGAVLDQLREALNQ